MGLTAADHARHIAIDIGVFGMGQALARLLDAPFLCQTYSRLVIDCNRDPVTDDAMPLLSDGTAIAGNATLDEAAKEARIAAIHRPYHQAIADLLDQRRANEQDTILLSLHSFTPVLAGVTRPWEVGILHWRGRIDYAQALLAVLHDEATLTVGDNAPYAMDATDFTVPFHAFPRSIAYAEIEVRQDLIGDTEGQMRWADRLACAALRALV